MMKKGSAKDHVLHHSTEVFSRSGHSHRKDVRVGWDCCSELEEPEQQTANVDGAWGESKGPQIKLFLHN